MKSVAFFVSTFVDNAYCPISSEKLILKIKKYGHLGSQVINQTRIVDIIFSTNVFLVQRAFESGCPDDPQLKVILAPSTYRLSS